MVWHFVACREIAHDADGSVTLRQLVHAILPAPGESYPCIRERLALYALLTNGRGRHEIALEPTRFERGQEISVLKTGARTVDLGSDPLAVIGMPMPLRNVIFQEAGQYTFHLICDGKAIAEEKLLLKEPT
jgi:hypothetical protein